MRPCASLPSCPAAPPPPPLLLLTNAAFLIGQFAAPMLSAPLPHRPTTNNTAAKRAPPPPKTRRCLFMNPQPLLFHSALPPRVH